MNVSTCSFGTALLSSSAARRCACSLGYSHAVLMYLTLGAFSLTSFLCSVFCFLAGGGFEPPPFFPPPAPAPPAALLELLG